RFYRGYNASSDPAWIYFMALDGHGRIYRIGGFPTNDFSSMVSRWLKKTPVITNQAAIEVTSTYFKYLEGWLPGVVSSPADAALLPLEAHKCGAIYPEVHACRTLRETTISAILFDERSLGTQCV